MEEAKMEVKTDKWQAAATKLATEVPYYRIVKPNWHHLVNAVATGPYTEITDDNLDDVLAFLRDRVEPERDHDAPMLPEAPASWNLTYYIKGRREQITLRGMTYAQIATQAKAARAWISEHADEPHIPGGNGQREAAQPKQAKQPSTPPLPDEPVYEDIVPAGPEHAGSTTTIPTSDTLTFKPEILVASVTEGKVYWKVKGGHWSKYGVSIWPEVLDAAQLTDLDPTQQYSLTHFKTAVYINNEKGQPSKVLQLTA